MSRPGLACTASSLPCENAFDRRAHSAKPASQRGDESGGSSMPGAMLVQSIQVRAAARDAERARALLAIYVSTLYAHTAQSLTAIPTIAGRAWPLHRLCITWEPKGPLVPSLARCNRYSPSREAVHPRWRALRWRASRDRSLSSHGRRATVSRRSGKAARYRSGKSTYRWRA